MALEALLSADDPVNGGPRDPRGAEAARQAALRLASPRCAAGDEQACEDGATALLHMASHAPELRERARQGRLRGLALRERRCDAGAPAACEAVASALEDGQLVPRDKPRAHALHVRACEGGVAEACKNASIDYQMGHDVAVDRARAAALLERACELCDADACDSVALAAKGAGRPFVDPRKKRRGDAPIR
jgi:TPR repeat protein